jgi:hypothetical protein
MTGSILYVAVFLMIALIATILVGRSKENREGNASYDKSTGRNWVRLAVFYVLAAALGIACVLMFIL